jgi:hypothetical protein
MYLFIKVIHYNFVFNKIISEIKVGASAQASSSKDFYWQDGTKVNSSFWCDGEPKGGSGNLCAYTSQHVLYSEQKCIKTGGCDNNWFDHGLICHYVYEI